MTYKYQGLGAGKISPARERQIVAAGIIAVLLYVAFAWLLLMIVGPR